MNHFCTYCDQGYAARMLCLHASLRRQGEPFRLFVLCFDAATAAVVAAKNDPDLIAIPLEEFLAAEPDYAAVRSRRSQVEFYFTATPVLARHCLRRAPEAEAMTYLDADLFFFGPPSAVFAEQGDAAVGIVPHRFREETPELLSHGVYNVAWVSFRRVPSGLACLDWWRERCLEWCHDRVEAGKFADQGYLDRFPELFEGVRALEHPGVNLAPWNVASERLAGGADGRPVIDGCPVIFYHYQGIREVAPGWFDPGLKSYGLEPVASLRDWIYLPYLRELAEVQRRLDEAHGIKPALGYKRLPEGNSAGAILNRWIIRHAMPWARRLSGRLLKVEQTR